MKKCNLCYDRTAQDLQPWCAQACPTDALWYGTYEEFAAERKGKAVRETVFGAQTVRTRVEYVVRDEIQPIDVSGLLGDGVGARDGGHEHAAPWIL